MFIMRVRANFSFRLCSTVYSVWPLQRLENKLSTIREIAGS